MRLTPNALVGFVAAIILILSGVALAQPAGPHTVYGNIQRYEGTIPPEACLHIQFTFGAHHYDETSPEFSYDEPTGTFFLQITDDLFSVGDSIRIDAGDSCLYEEVTYATTFDAGPETYIEDLIIMNPIEGLRPMLLAGYMDPTTGYVTDNYEFGVTYYSTPWGRAPNYVRVWIDDVSYWDMAWAGSGSPHYDLGEPYDVVIPGTSIGKGDHYYYFYAEDNLGLPVWTDFVFFTILNSAPTPPTIHVTPEQAFDDENIEVVIDVDGGDADTDPLTYWYDWYRDGDLQSAYSGFGENVLPFAATSVGEVWEVQVYSYDGEEMSATYASDVAVVIAPTLTDGDVDPTSGDRSTSFTYSVTYTNLRDVAPAGVNVIIDGGAPIAMTESRDYSDGVEFTYSTTLDLGEHDYQFEATDVLGHPAIGDTGVHEGPTVGNNLPTIESASLDVDPSPATEISTLTAIPSGWYDDDGDPEGYHYNWYVNDVSIDQHTVSLNGDYFDHGDEVYCEVIPYDGYDEGDGVNTETVTIENTLPTAPVAEYSPDPVYDNDDIVVSITTPSYDPDDDVLTYHYVFSIDGEPVGVEGESTLDADETTPGDVVHVEVWADDGYDKRGAPRGEGDIFEFDIDIEWPTLSDGDVEPASGHPTVEFQYQVTYTSERNLAPDVIYVNIDGEDFAMSPVDPDDEDYTDGYDLYYNTTLPFGDDHTYLFYGTDELGNDALGEDYEHEGPEHTNTQPEITDIEITPYPTATETDVIELYVTANDDDDDPTTILYQWYNGEDAIVGATSSTLDGEYFDKGDVVWAYVWANDGYEDGPESPSDEVTIVNTPPTISDVDIIADPDGWFNEAGEIIAVVEADDVDDDELTFEYIWYVNDADCGATGDRIDGTYFDRGDTVYFQVTVSDDEEEGDTEVSEEVIIGNAPPIFEYLAITPEEPTTMSKLELSLAVDDPDGDYFTLAYEWYVDGELLSGWDKNYIPSHYTEKHETWEVVVSALDIYEGTNDESDAVTILNTPPIVDAVSETVVVYGTPYYNKIYAFDPDADHIVYHLLDGPDGLVLDTLTGDLSWTDFAGVDTLGVYPVALTVSDDDDDVVLAFNLHVYPLADDLFAPSNLDALSGYLLSIPTSWDPPAFFATSDWLSLTFVGYEVQRSLSGGDWSTLAYVDGAGYVDLDVTNGTTYYYRVRAVYEEGVSSWSNTDFAACGAAGSTMLYSVYTYGPFPEIDGVLDASEWSDATMLVLGDQTLYVKNTENMLYIAYVDGQDVSLDTDDAFYVEIEDNHNLRWPALEGSSEGEYRVTAADGGTSEATYQGIWGTYPGGIGRDIRGPYDEVVGAVGGGDGSPVIYELSIEIDPDDLAAVNSSMGSVVGFRFASYDAGALEWTKVWLSGSDATDPESFGNLMLGIGAGGPNFSVWYSAYEVWLYESETTTRPMWVSNLGNGSIDYALYESYLPFWGDGGRSSGHPVLLYTDEASTVGEEALTFLGYGYDVVTTQTDFLSYLEPEDYDVVIVTKLTALAATELAKIKNFLWHGGKVIITCPDLEGTNSNVLWEEAGLQIYADLGATPSAINWDVPDHPVFDTPLDVPPSVETVEGVYTDYGDGILSDGATILASHDELPYPANGAITLSSDGAMFLNSFVMSDSRDSDFDDMADGVELLINELFYLAALEEVPWLDVDIEEGTLTSHQTHNAIVTFDATSLVEGDYEGYIIATSSDPATPVVSVPCILHVCEPDFALVRLAFPSESQMVSPGEDFELPITAEGLNDAGITDLTITVQTVSSVVSPVNVTSDDYEVTVTGYDLDYITFELSSDILMDDGVICNVEFAVPTTAPVASFCNIAIDDVEYNAGAFVEAIEKINGRVVIEAGEMDWLVELDFTHGSFADEIEIGVTPGATDAFDEEIDVLNDPPSHWFDPYSDISAFDPVYGELDGDIRSPYDDMVEWTIPVGDSAGKLEWSFRDEDTLSYMGSLFLNGDINMKEAPFYYLFEAGETLTIIYRKTGESPFDIVLYPGWNMVSLPIVPVEVDATPAGVYPDAEYTYYYDATTGMWTAASAIEPGVGYAVLALSEQQYTLWGQPVSFYTYDLTRGWNLIGTTYDEVDFSSPTTNPPGAVMGAPEHAYYYDILLGDYTRTDELTPGNGYFVAAQNDAVLSVPGVSGKKALVPTTDYSVQIQVVVDGESKTLTLGASSVDWLMPIPPAPDGSVPEAYLSVDGWRAKAAYCNDAVACDLVVSGCAEVTASGLPEGLNAFVSVDGKKLPLDESAILPAAGSYKITVGDLPRQFALHANVPNPFNPTTAIRFDIPERCEVKLDVYDLLGNKVTTLQDGELSTGRHTVLWDGVDISGQPVPSGVYFYRLVAGEKKATRRMLLLK